MHLTNLVLGFTMGAVIAWLAQRAGALNRSGAVAAALTGGLIFGLGGLAWATLLLTFFVSSSALSRAFGRRKVALSEKFSKGHQRDVGQVLANGGLGALLTLAHLFSPEQIWPWIAFAGAMAAVNADTWATELGVLNPTLPRLITTGKRVERGSSGAVSLLGSLSAVGGAALIGLIAASFTLRMTSSPGASARIYWAALIGGVCGAFADSLAGAVVQAIYWCPRCLKETERHPLHTCGAQTTQRRGWRWLNNDMVNFLASLVGAVIAVLLYSL
jgi:uncharacterized protein (TIGR00297 family)